MVSKWKMMTLACVALGLIAALGASGQSRINLVVWFPSAGDTSSPAREQFNKGFESRHPNVKVVEAAQPNDNWDQLLKAANLAGNGPDVVKLWPGSPTTDYIPFLLPLGKYLDAKFIANRYGWELAREGFKTTGEVYGIPDAAYSYCIWYNKTLLAKVGVTEKNLPKSWDELLGVCGKLKANGITPFVVGTKDGYIVQWGVACLLTTMMGTDGPAKVEDLSYKYVGSEVQKATEMWQELAKRGYLNADAASLSTGDDMDMSFVNGGGAMLLSGNWELTALSKGGMTDNLGFFPFPAVDPKGRFKDYNYAGPGSNYCITKYTKHPDEAAAYIKELATDKDFELATANERGDLPVDLSFDASKVTNPYTRKFSEILKAGKNVIILDLVPLNAFNEFVRMGGSITLNKMSAAEVMAIMDKEIEKMKNQ